MLVVSGGGTALILEAVGNRRFDRANELKPGALDQYPVQFPVERWAVGAAWQFRFIPSTRRWWAPGNLGVGYDAVRFVPSSAARSHLAWSARPTSVKIIKALKVCMVRFDTPEGPASSRCSSPSEEVEADLAPFVAVVAAHEAP